jgi:hypothetical protein
MSRKPNSCPCSLLATNAVTFGTGARGEHRKKLSNREEQRFPFFFTIIDKQPCFLLLASICTSSLHASAAHSGPMRQVQHVLSSSLLIRPTPLSIHTHRQASQRTVLSSSRASSSKNQAESLLLHKAYHTSTSTKATMSGAQTNPANRRLERLSSHLTKKVRKSVRREGGAIVLRGGRGRVCVMVERATSTHDFVVVGAPRPEASKPTDIAGSYAGVVHVCWAVLVRRRRSLCHVKAPPSLLASSFPSSFY